jgi:hypothetical protein
MAVVHKFHQQKGSNSNQPLGKEESEEDRVS